MEHFFRWIKQYLRIKTFYGTSPNAVRTQIRTAVSIYLLIAILKKRLNLPGSLRTILTGRLEGAEDVLSMGLLNRVVKAGTAREEAEKVASEIAAFPQHCMRSGR